MITKSHLEKLRKEKIEEILINSKHNKPNLPSPLFDTNGKFNEYNWCGGDAVLRKFIYYIEDMMYNSTLCTTRYLSDYLKKNDPEYIEPDVENDIAFIITVHRFNDDVYCNITIHEDETFNIKSYNIKWYKDRGRIDHILLNGKLITEDEYLELLNFIQDYQIYDFKII